jgi:hypothetical protein
MQILTERQEAILKDERQLLNDLRVALVQFGATEEDQSTLSESIHQLDELFLLAVKAPSSTRSWGKKRSKKALPPQQHRSIFCAMAPMKSAR